MIKVVNLRNFEVHKYMYLVKVDRSTVLGNQYKIGVDGTRAEVIEKYRQDLWKHIQQRDHISLALYDLYKGWKWNGIIYLACWCAPEACHADVIKSCLEWMDEEKFNLY